MLGRVLSLDAGRPPEWQSSPGLSVVAGGDLLTWRLGRAAREMAWQVCTLVGRLEAGCPPRRR